MVAKILLSGLKPTGRPHLGNYFGAMRQWVDLQTKCQTLAMIADYHALTTNHEPEELRQNTYDVAVDYLAIGLDPERAILFKQSDVPEHAELCWIFNCLTTVPYLQRAHAYKDSVAKGGEVSVGTFAYPLLMAADILLYNADLVPVGQDQKQHLEIARDTADKFNRTFGEIFKLPEALILPTLGLVPGIDGRKMSKSYGNTIPLFATDTEIKKQVMAIVTDSSEGIPKNVYALHKLLVNTPELESIYEEKRGKYKELKEMLINDMIKFIRPLRERRAEIASDPSRVRQIITNGGALARDRARLKLAQIRRQVGVDL